jgi:hypothetical protein
MWGVFTKAGQPGWAAIVPFYNIYVLLKITEKPEWWLVIWVCCPVVNLICLVLVAVELANRFGKGAGYAVGLIFLPFIFYPLLGFGDAQYMAASRRVGDYEDHDDRPRRGPRREDFDEPEERFREGRRDEKPPEEDEGQFRPS